MKDNCGSCSKQRLCENEDGTLGECQGHDLLAVIADKEFLHKSALELIAELKADIAKLKDTCKTV